MPTIKNHAVGSKGVEPATKQKLPSMIPFDYMDRHIGEQTTKFCIDDAATARHDVAARDLRTSKPSLQIGTLSRRKIRSMSQAGPTATNTRLYRPAVLTACSLAILAAAISQSSQAQTTAPAADTAAAAAPAETPWAPPATLSDWAGAIKYGAQVDAGFVANPQGPQNGQNFGQLFTDKANHPILNQLLLTMERDLDPKATDYDFGFKFQGMYGSDARIVHTLGVFDQLIHDRNQIDVVEANVQAHTPWLFEGGIDFKGGIYPTPLGFEVIDAKGNPFYSHSYIFNFGLPFNHLGLLSTAHVNSMVDVYVGIDSGTNTSVGSGDNNDRPGGIVGFGLNFLGGNLTLLALSHMGPENSTLNTTFANSAMRYYNDVVVTYKHSDKLSFTTELNYVKEDGFRAEGYGAAQYAAYNLTDTLTLNGRAEIWRDNSNFFVANPKGPLDYVNYQRGVFSNFYVSPAATTYSEFTVGVTWKPDGLPAPISNLMIRPELRYDRSLSGAKPYGGGSLKGSFYAASDIVLGF